MGIAGEQDGTPQKGRFGEDEGIMNFLRRQQPGLPQAGRNVLDDAMPNRSDFQKIKPRMLDLAQRASAQLPAGGCPILQRNMDKLLKYRRGDDKSRVG